MVVMAGLARKTDEGIYNSVLVIHRGKLLGVYDKIMLTSGDKKLFLPGKSIPVFEAHGAHFAVVICADTSFLHPALAARLQGAEILFTPHYNRIGERLMDDHRRWVRNCHVGLACHLRMVVARSNIVSGDARGGLSYGDSLILSPGGEVLAEANLFRTELLTARVTSAMFRMPHAWSDLDQVPPWLRTKLGELLDGQGGPPAESKAAQVVR
jgi:predicted amidohydrolase